MTTTTTTSSLEQVAARAVAGDAAALGELCGALETPVFRLCLRVLGSRTDAEDATQEVLVKVITNLASFEGRSSLRTWVHRIALRHVLAMAASRAEQRAVPLDDYDALIDRGLAFSASAPPPSPEERVLEREVRMSCTQGMLLALDREDRVAVVLVDVLGFSTGDAAEIAEISHDALRKRLSRARKRLEAFLQRTCGLVDERAACRCERQIPAKRALGTTRPHLSVLASDDAAVAAASELRTVARVFALDPVTAPAIIRARLQTLLPTLLYH